MIPLVPQLGWEKSFYLGPETPLRCIKAHSSEVAAAPRRQSIKFCLLPQSGLCFPWLGHREFVQVQIMLLSKKHCWPLVAKGFTCSVVNALSCLLLHEIFVRLWGSNFFLIRSQSQLKGLLLPSSFHVQNGFSCSGLSIPYSVVRELRRAPSTILGGFYSV